MVAGFEVHDQVAGIALDRLAVSQPGAQPQRACLLTQTHPGSGCALQDQANLPAELQTDVVAHPVQQLPRARRTRQEGPIRRQADRADLLEGSFVYRIKDTTQYLCLVECADKNWDRYYRAFTADRLDGEWKPLPGADSAASPFAGNPNVSAEPGATPWANGISHGELLREGSDETMTVDPKNLQLLYQGIPPGASAPDYLLLPYRLALLKPAPAK